MVVIEKKYFEVLVGIFVLGSPEFKKRVAQTAAYNDSEAAGRIGRRGVRPSRDEVFTCV